jgi:hypothetical protein
LPGLVIGVWQTRRGPATVAAALRPRFRKRRSHGDMRVTLGTGLYLKGRSLIVHFVDHRGFVHRVSRINAAQLKPVAVSAVKVDDTLPRLHAAVAPHAFETLSRGQLLAGDVGGALMILQHAVQYDLSRFRQRQLRAQTSLKIAPEAYAGVAVVPAPDLVPRFNLYDLLARESVRAGNAAAMAAMVARLKAEPPATRRLFADRLAKWTDNDSSWYKKYADGSKKTK